MSCFLMRDICFSINRMSGFLEFYVRRTNGSVRKAAYTTTMIEGKLHRCLTGIDKQTEITTTLCFFPCYARLFKVCFWVLVVLY